MGLRSKPHPENRFSTFGPRKKRINPVSKKTSKERDELRPHREWLKLSAGCCMRCGDAPEEGEELEDLDLHEIPAGSHRNRALKLLPWVSLVLCRTCHDELQGVDPNRQVAILKAWIEACINDCFGRDVL